MASNNAQTGDGRGDSLETRASAPTEEDFSDDSFEYDDEEVIRMRLAASGRNGPVLPTPSQPPQSTRPKLPSVQERTDAILKDLRGRISGLSDGLHALRQQARQLSFDFVEEERRLDDLKPLRRQYVKKIKSQIQQLEELNYLNDLIAYLESSEKEIVLLPCRHGPKGEVFPCESDSTDSFHDLSLAELGESYREFSSDESATGL